MLIIPNVIINEGTLPIDINVPLTSPIIKAATKAINIGTIIPSIIRPKSFKLRLYTYLCKTAILRPENAMTEPTDKSIPAVIMTNVIPTPIIVVIEICRSMLVKLVKLKKYGEIIDNKITKITSITIIPILKIKFFNTSMNFFN